MLKMRIVVMVPPNVTILNIKSSSVTHFIEDELIYDNSNDIGVVVEKVKKNKNGKEILERYNHFIVFHNIF